MPAKATKHSLRTKVLKQSFKFSLRSNYKKASIFSRPLFFLGLSLVLISLSFQIYQSRVLSFSKPFELQQIAATKSPPTQISVPKINLSLPIVDSKINKGVWEINPSGGSHLLGSANPGEPGNIILYGHNKPELFRDIVELKIGDKIILTSSDQTLHAYQIVETKIVSPDEVSVLSPTPDETLTFYTCTGFLDTKRFIVRAKPILN